MANKTTDNRRRGRIPALENQGQVQDAVDPSSLRARPANENDPATAMMLARLRRAPSYTVFVGVFFLSLIWVFTWSYVYSDLLVASQAAAKRNPAEQLQALIMLAVPIASMFAIAYFQWRAQQLKQVSEVLMHQAMRLIRPQDLATEGLTSIAQAVRQEVDLLVGGVEHAFQRATALEEIVHKEISSVERAFGSNEERIRGLVAGLEGQRLALQQSAAMVNQDAEPMLGRLASSTQNLNQVIDLALSTFDRLEDGLKGSTSDLARTIESVALSAATTGQEIGGHSMELQRLSSGLLHDFQSFSAQLNDHVQTLHYAADSLGNETKKFGGEIKGLETNLLLNLRQSVEQMQATGTSVNDLLVGTSGTIAAHLKDTSEIVTRQMQDSGLTLAQNLENSGGLVSERLANMSGTIAAHLKESSEIVTRQMQDSGGMVGERLTNMSGTIAAHIKDTSDIVTRQMQESGLALAQNLENSGGIVTERLVNISGEFMQKLTATNAAMVSNIMQSTNDLEGRFETISGEIINRVDSLSVDTVGHLETVANRVNEQVSSVTQQLTSKLDNSSIQLGSLLGSTEQRLGNQLEQATAELGALFSINTTTMVERLNTTSSDLGQRFDAATEHLASVTGEISKRLDDHGQRFAETLNSASGQIFTDLGKARDAFSEGLGETAMQITGRFEQETGLIVGRIDSAISAFDAAATSSSGKLEGAADKFSKHIETTNTYLADQLASAAGDIDSKLETVSMQLTGRLEMTGTRISDRLEDVSALVEKSITKFNTEMENTLTSRRDAMDKLVEDAHRRSVEVDSGLASYMALIEESLNAAEARAQSISRIVNEQTSQALGQLEEELGRLETNSTGQVAQAARALREQHERALASMNEMLSSTASDFQQTAQDMRITAQQVVKDIDSARNELKRAVIDLPEETRANADNMRKVVADQISALNALSDVVRQQSGSINYSSPGYASPRAPYGSGGSGPGKSEGASFLSPVSGSMSARQTVADRPAATERKTQGETSSVGNLAREVDAYSAKLNAAARDVVEALDGGLPRDIEKRYAGSDKSAYTHRLYENRSRKMLKSIESRYAEERLLRSRIQAYNRLFEKLLDVLSEAKGGDDVMEQVLASEQGRIYVMLAEAAGRLPSQS